MLQFAPQRWIGQVGWQDVLTPHPAAEGIEAWIEVDGRRHEEWPAGLRKVTLELPVGERRIAVKSVAEGKKFLVADKRVVIKQYATTQMMAGYEGVKPTK